MGNQQTEDSMYNIWVWVPIINWNQYHLCLWIVWPSDDSSLPNLQSTQQPFHESTWLGSWHVFYSSIFPVLYFTLSLPLINWPHVCVEGSFERGSIRFDTRESNKIRHSSVHGTRASLHSSHTLKQRRSSRRRPWLHYNSCSLGTDLSQENNGWKAGVFFRLGFLVGLTRQVARVSYTTAEMGL